MIAVKSKLNDRMILLGIGIASVVAVCVSTAQVVYALAFQDWDLASQSNLSDPAIGNKAELSVTLVELPDSRKYALVLENVTGVELNINGFATNASHFEIPFTKMDTTPITLPPDGIVTVRIKWHHYSDTEQRALPMKGRVIDGNVVLFSDSDIVVSENVLKTPSFPTDKSLNRQIVRLNN